MRILLTCSLFYVFLAMVGCSEFDHLAINNPCDPLYDGPLSCNHVPDTGTLLTPDSHTPDDQHPDQTPGPGGECLDNSGSVMRGWCHIDGTCVMGADENPEDSCQYCHPARSTDSWNHRPEGTGCQVVNGDDREDGICAAGTCTPSAQEVCECGEESPCCDGCHPINTGAECLPGDSTFPCIESHCSPQGTCVESVMEGWCLTHDGQCRHTMDDRDHCGECHHPCNQDELCQDGVCVPDCGPLAQCDNLCVDLESDTSHCGRCGQGCSGGQICHQGECLTHCEQDLTLCDQECVDTDTSTLHCGRCFNPCNGGAVCVESQCVIRVTGITVEPVTASLGTGRTIQLNAIVEPANATNRAVRWYSSVPAVATVDETGLVTGVTTGQATITAATSNGVTDAITVTVGISVTGVAIEPGDGATVGIGEVVTLEAIISPPEATNQGITWTSADPSVATVDENGKVSGEWTGFTMITATTHDGAYTCETLVTVPGVRILNGTFQMGSDRSYPTDEISHRVTLTNSFWMQPTQVTQGEWVELMGNNPSHFNECGEDCPVENITWFSTVEFANTLSEDQDLPPCYRLQGCTGTAADGTLADCTVTVTGTGGNPYNCTGYRLPTEAEWEYAAKAGTTTSMYSGDLPAHDSNHCVSMEHLLLSAWYCANSEIITHPVALLNSNPWELYDMIGNTAEYAWDQYMQNLGTTAVVDPVGPQNNPNWRTGRGCSYGARISSCWASKRILREPNSRNAGSGFRLVRTIQE